MDCNNCGVSGASVRVDVSLRTSDGVFKLNHVEYGTYLCDKCADKIEYMVKRKTK